MPLTGQIVLASSSSNAKVLLSAPSGYDLAERYAFHVSLSYGGQMQASGDVSDIRVPDSDETPSLPGYFKRLADDWKGWEGIREWESVDQRLRLGCTTDRTGHAHLAVSLRGDRFLNPQWEATVSVVLDVEQRRRVARDIAVYFVD